MKYYLTLLCTIFSLNLFADSTSYVVGLEASPPFVILNDNNEWEGINVWLWEKIANEEGFDFIYKQVKLEHLKDSDSIDIFIAPFIMDGVNAQFYKFSPPYYTSNSAVLVNKANGFQSAWNFIKSILSINFLRLVLAIFTLLLIVGLIVWLLERRKNDQFEKGFKGIGSGIWWSAVTLSTVGYGDKTPKTLSGRIIGTIWMFAGILVVSAFTASMASLLTVNQINASNNSINDFKHKNIGAIKESSSYYFLKTNFFKDIKTVTNLEEGIELMQSKEIDAFVGDEPSLKYLIKDKALEDFTLINNRFSPKFYSFAFSKTQESLHLKSSKKLYNIVNGVEWQLLLEEYNISYR